MTIRKKLCLALILMSGFSMANAQIAQWKLRPLYDTIFIPKGALFAVTQNRSSHTTTLWTLTEFEKIRQVYGKMHEFHDEVSVNTAQDDSKVLGFVLNTGWYITLPTGSNYTVDLSYPYFSDGHLVVQEPTTKHFRYIDKKGAPSIYRYKIAYPFFKGFASCEYYQDQVKLSNPKWRLINKEMKMVLFSFQGKEIKKTDIDFVSSVNDENTAVLIANKKVYLYNAETEKLTPLCSKLGNENLKEQAKLTENLSNSLVQGDNLWGLKVKCTKNDMVKIFFDKFMRPTMIQYTDTVKYYNSYVEQPSALSTSLKVVKGKGGYGLSRGNEEILVPQFESIPFCFVDKAFVKKDGEYGAVQVFPEKHFNVWIYDKDAVMPFVHKDLKTTIQIDIPQEFSIDSVTINMDKRQDFVIDRDSREEKHTDITNWVKYNCTLKIPSALFSNETTEMDIPLQIQYDGFLSPVIHVKKQATIRKYWSVNVDNEHWYGDDSLSFDFSLEYSDPMARDAKYGVSVTVEPKEICQIVPFTFTKYRCTMQKIKKGLNQVEITVTEDGFPSAVFPYIFEHKPETPPAVEKTEVKVPTVTPPTSEGPKKEGKKPQKPNNKKESKQIIVPNF